jgi:ribose/xylose/arabinose/galactoside ABC-type transport system permease subunit
MNNKPGKTGFGYRLLLTPEIGVFIPILIVGLITTIIDSTFITRRYLASILTSSIAMGSAALGQALVIMSGDIDLSLGYVGCFAGIMCGRAAMAWGWGLFPCIVLGLVTGLLIGTITGFLVTKVGITSWITTLAVQFVCSGLSLTVTQGYTQEINSPELLEFTLANPLGLSWLFFIYVGLVVFMDFIVRKTSFGYELRAIGGNKEAAGMAGIDVRKVKWIAFALAGLLAAVGGLFDVLPNGMASPTFGAGREFRAITCCAIGGLSLAGGAGSIYGVALGVLLLQTLIYCLRLLGVSINLQLVLIGTILILAVVLDMQRKRIEARMLV